MAYCRWMAWTGVACSPLWLYGKGKGFVAVVRFQW